MNFPHDEVDKRHNHSGDDEDNDGDHDDKKGSEDKNGSATDDKEHSRADDHVDDDNGKDDKAAAVAVNDADCEKNEDNRRGENADKDNAGTDKVVDINKMKIRVKRGSEAGSSVPINTNDVSMDPGVTVFADCDVYINGQGKRMKMVEMVV